MLVGFLTIILIFIGVQFYKYYQYKEVETTIDDIANKSPGILIDNRKQAVDYMWNILEPVHDGLRREAIVITYLNEMNKIIKTDVQIGEATSVTYPTDMIVNGAVAARAIKIIVGHNHPGNYTMPSDQDVYHCSSLYLALLSKGIRLMDDLVVCGVQLKSIMNTLRFKQMVRNY